MQKHFFESLSKLFNYYKVLGEKVFDQLEDDQLFAAPKDESNNIGTIVKHLSGNMLSRWTEFLTSDGEKEWRERDTEFVNDIQSRAEMLTKWNAGWDCLFSALNDASHVEISKIVYIRNQGHTVLEVFHRQLAHYAYHIGQIVHIGKVIKGNKWKSLSIPRGQSRLYNKQKFSKQKEGSHFTDELLDSED